MPYLTMIDSTRIYYEDIGKGETILFTHGLCSSHLEFKALINEFKSNYRCISYDHRGHESSDKPKIHMNLKTLAQDLNELIEYLNLSNITIIGHSLGGAVIFNYINQFGCSKLKRVIIADMSPYMRNDGWKGGISNGKWTDKDFLIDMDNFFDDIGKANWRIVVECMLPGNKNKSIETKQDSPPSSVFNPTEPFVMSSLWWPLFRTDQRPFISKITVPFIYIMPQYGLYSMEAVNFYKENVKGGFILENISDTTHSLLTEKPHEIAECIKKHLS